MSQSVNRGEKSAASEAAADAVEPVEVTEPAEPVGQSEESEAAPATEQPEDRAADGDSAEGEHADDTPTLNLDDESQDDPDE